MSQAVFPGRFALEAIGQAARLSSDRDLPNVSITQINNCLNIETPVIAGISRFVSFSQSF
jgi:hypothetical protein